MSLAFNIDKILNVEDVDRDNYFNILGCSENSTAEQISTEYRLRALKCHPDKNPGNEGALQEFQRLQEARDILSDPTLRGHYDKWRHSEMAIPFKTWLNMTDRCAATMHWAKPRSGRMLENPNDGCGMDDPDIQEFIRREPHPQEQNDMVKRGQRAAWEPDESSSVYSQFRNYKI